MIDVFVIWALTAHSRMLSEACRDDACGSARLLRSRDYLRLLALAAILGVPVSAAAYGFLALVSYLQKEIFTHLPHGLGFATEPIWWPLPVLAAGGIIAGLAIRYLPGRGGPSPAGGFKMHGAADPEQLPGIILAALATLVFGAVARAGDAADPRRRRPGRAGGPPGPAGCAGPGRGGARRLGKLRRHQHPAGESPSWAPSC